MSQTESLRNFTVGEIEVSPQHNTLRYQTRTITVQPKVMAVLYYLAQHQVRVVGNEELLQAVWHGRIVTLASVQKSINALRSALVDLAGSQEFVAYFSKRGYQLMPAVTWSEQQAQHSAPVSITVESSSTPSQLNSTDKIQVNTPAFEVTEPTPRQTAPTQDEAIQNASVKSAAVDTPKGVSQFTTLHALLGFALLIALFAIIHFYPTAPIGNSTTQIAQAGTSVQPDVNPTQKPLPWQIISTYLPAASNAHHTTPSPDSKRAAYLRDTEINGAIQSDLMIRDLAGTDWLLARSNSTWADLAWSPSGRALAALEIYRADNVLQDPDFYETPQYLYNIHLFTLDLKGQHLLEKNLLSQWQGKVNSITWWDENTLEFVATMGASITKERYRYSVTDQTLTTLGAPASGYQPLVSRVRNKITALISRQRDKTQVEFLNEQQNLIGKHSIDSSIYDLGWGEDTSAVFALDTHQNKIHYFPIQGAPNLAALPAPLNDFPFGSLNDLKIDSSGKSIFITASTQPAKLDQNNPQGIKHLADINNLIKSSVAYSPLEDAVIYATHQNSQAQIWLLKHNQAEALYKSDGPIQSIHWSSPEHLLIKTNSTIDLYQLNNHKWRTLVEQAHDMDPLAFNPETHTLLVVKQINDVRNIWRVNVDTLQQKQLTFGEVGTARSWNNSVYFQYANQAGLWQLNTQDPNHIAINDKLPQHSMLLGFSSNNVYFITGGSCHESDIQQLDLSHNTLSTYLKRQDSKVTSIDFSTTQGVLQIPCSAHAYTSYEIRAR
ncbi:MAG TPA: winged helix-turn-helix domain-containing protein [Cellvibrionaceae bacterium]